MAPRLRIAFLRLLAFSAAAVVLAGGASALARPVPAPDPTGEAYEQGVIDFLNEVRARPLPPLDTQDSGVWDFVTRSGGGAEMGGNWRTPFSDADYTDVHLPSLTESGLLDRAAQAQADYLGASGLQTHTGPAGSTPGVRIRGLGFNSTMTAEELAFGARSPEDVIIRLLKDAGVPGAPHRHDLLNPVFTFVGVGCARHPHFGNVCVIELSTAPFGTSTTADGGLQPDEGRAMLEATFNEDPGAPPPGCPLSPVGTYSLPLDQYLGFLLDAPGAELPDLVLAGTAYRPSETFEAEPDVNWANWGDFDRISPDPVPCHKWIRARLIGGDYGGFSVAPYTPSEADEGKEDEGKTPM